MARTEDHISEVRAAVTQILDALDQLRALRREWDSLDYVNTLPDGSGTNAGITRAEIANAYTSIGELDTYVYTAGRNTSLQNVRT